MSDLVIRKERWSRIRAAVNGLLRQCELPVQRVIISESGVSALGQDNLEVGRIDLSSDYTHPAWVQMKQGGSVSVHIDLEAADVH